MRDMAQRGSGCAKLPGDPARGEWQILIGQTPPSSAGFAEVSENGRHVTR